jgi:polysaccharide export outer membrane protein
MLGLALLSGCATNDKSEMAESVSKPVHYEAGNGLIDTNVDNLMLGTLPETAAASLPAIAGEAGNPDAFTLDTIERLDDYRIGPEDLLEIRVFGVEELSQTVRVNSAGFISMPLIGQLRAAGLRSIDLEKRIAAKLAENYLQDPSVNVFIQEYFSQRVVVAGAIEKAGIYALRGPTTLGQVIAMAGGLGQLAAPDDVKVIRVLDGEKRTLSFDLNAIAQGAVDDPYVLGNDYIIVPRSQARVLLRDSLLKDVADFLNPFRFIIPH